MWSPCISGAAYTIGIDWDEDGSFTGFDDLTEDVLDRGITSTYGRDQNRQLTPAFVGSAAFDVCNVSRIFSPENTDSPIVDNLGPARSTRIQVEFNNTTHQIHNGLVDDFTVRADFTDRSVGFTSLDGLALLQNALLSTPILEAERTGEIINFILDEIGWTGSRDIDIGANHVPWWWEESTDAFTAVRNLIISEGPPSIAYVAPDGTFIFRDRHHRIQDNTSLDSQAFFNANEISCESFPVSGFGYTAPFVYIHGWRDIINHVSQDVEIRTPEPGISEVWRDGGFYQIAAGETLSLNTVSSGPFFITTDFGPFVEFDSISGAASLSISISRTSGQSVMLHLEAVGAPVSFTGIRLLARRLSSESLAKVDEEDSSSVQRHGDKFYPFDIVWADKNNVEALAQIILAHYAERRPTVQMRITSCDADHLLQILTRTISDRITIRNDELRLFSDFFVESVAHTIQRINTEQGVVHSVILGCEKTLEVMNDCFTFDKVGAGFDQGVFCGEGIDNPETVFIFDDLDNGQFDFGVFGT